MSMHLMDIRQGTPEWLELRKNKITATDAAIIMGASHWKTKIQLYNEKISDITPVFCNERMQRGIDLEPIARALFMLETGVEVVPKVVVKDWAMASLDGISELENCIVEIKCPGKKDHNEALLGRVPDHYYPQLQHQLYVCEAEEMYYYSFDGTDGVSVIVKRDQKYIDKMIKEEMKFYACLMNNISPEPEEDDYLEINDPIWDQCAEKWKFLTYQIKVLEKQEQEIREQLIFLSGQSNVKGSGISMCQIKRKGNVDYSKIPQLKGIDLEPFRKDSINTWRINCMN